MQWNFALKALVNVRPKCENHTFRFQLQLQGFPAGTAGRQFLHLRDRAGSGRIIAVRFHGIRPVYRQTVGFNEPAWTGKAPLKAGLCVDTATIVTRLQEGPVNRDTFFADKGQVATGSDKRAAHPLQGLPAVMPETGHRPAARLCLLAQPHHFGVDAGLRQAGMGINRTDWIVGSHMIGQARGKQVHHVAGPDLLAPSNGLCETFI
ncbi:MAG: hypothetical protein OXC82_11500 [Rhodobacteraceae bacterium]|nr:hypothetical protein [Paracoccaceae bacterium]MCY4251042.1 hypothetical protein [Paracoccaceae bacterium]